MSLIKCPECGHDVSTTADFCPNCGWIVVVQENVEEDVLIKKSKAFTKQKKTKSNHTMQRKIFIIIAALSVVLLLSVPFIMVVVKFNNCIDSSFEKIDLINLRVESLEKQDYAIKESEYNRTLKLFKESLDVMESSMQEADLLYSKNKWLHKYFDSIVEKKTEYNDWSAYKNRINNFLWNGTTYDNAWYILNDAIEHLPEIIENSSQSDIVSTQSMFVISNIQSYNSGKVTADFTNNSTNNVRFVQVKVSVKDSYTKKTKNTDSTFAVGGEGLKPGESSKIECYIDKENVSDIITMEVYDYDFY